MNQFICVYDFETDGKIEGTDLPEPVQLGAIMINPRTLEVIAESEFCTMMRPIDIDSDGYYAKHLDTIRWHANNYTTDENNPVTAEQIFERWQKSIDQKVAWGYFTDYLLKYNTNQSRKGRFSAPIRAGSNIIRFDDLLIQRLCERYDGLTKEGEQKIFHPRDYIDINQLAFYWFHNLPEPSAYNMDVLRDFFGLSKQGGHDAMKDVRDEAWIIAKMMKLHRYFAPKVGFKGAAKRDEILQS